MARIVFDLDGTLIDSAPDLLAVANAILADEGAAPITLTAARSFIGQGTPVFLKKLRAARDIPDSEHERILKRFMLDYMTAVNLTKIYPGVGDTLEALASDGHNMGICTNKPIGPARAVLKHLGLECYFDTVIGGDSLPVHKPDPATLLTALGELGTGPALYVGDSEIDAETARRANIPFLLFTEGYPKSDQTRMNCARRFSEFSDLPALVEDLLRRVA